MVTDSNNKHIYIISCFSSKAENISLKEAEESIEDF